MKTRRPLTRSRNGWIFGVCQGLADYAEISVVWIRLLAIIGFFFTAGWPLVIIYIMAAIFMKLPSSVDLRSEDDWDLHCTLSSDRGLALNRLKHKFERLDRRTRRMEEIITAKEYDWERRFNSL